jgi:hypothetical protein
MSGITCGNRVKYLGWSILGNQSLFQYDAFERSDPMLRPIAVDCKEARNEGGVDITLVPQRYLY